MTDIDHEIQRSPLWHRILIWMFSLAFGALLFWLIGFLLQDISRISGPNYRELEEARLGTELKDTDERLQQEIATAERQIASLKKRQAILKTGIENSRQAIGQLNELTETTGSEGGTDAAASSTPDSKNAGNDSAMAENLRLFLADQRDYQALNQQIVQQNEQLETLQAQRAAHIRDWTEQRQPVDEEFQRLNRRHNLLLAGLKLLLLLPLLVLWTYLFRRHRQNYSSLIYAAGAALAGRLVQVIHQHLPSRAFNYILTLAAISVVLGIVLHLIRMIRKPDRDWRLRQYRQAYESFLCPICDYPIRRGPLKHMSWTRRSIKWAILRSPTSLDRSDVEPEQAYTCPVCATQLFEPCPQCEAIRHSLLPACQRCGDSVEPNAAA